MASNETQTATAAPVELELTPPDPAPMVAAEKAAGLVPVSDEKKSKLEEKVDAFVADLVSVDAASPATHRPGTLLRPSRSVATPPI